MDPGHELHLYVHEWNLGVDVRLHCDWGGGGVGRRKDNLRGGREPGFESQLKADFPQWIGRGDGIATVS